MEKTTIERNPTEPERLCYLNATRVEGPLPAFAGVEVRNQSDRKIGRLDGIVVDPAARSVRYLVVDAVKFPASQRYLLPFEETRVDLEHRAVVVDRNDLTRCEKFESRAFSSFSFRPRPA